MQTSYYVPDLNVSINGSPIPAALRASISSVSVQSALKGSDRMEMTLANENLRWLDHQMLTLDSNLTVSMGYTDSESEQLFVGQITGHDVSFPASGTPTITVAAQDRLHHLQQGSAVRWFAISGPCANYPLPDIAVTGIVSIGKGLIPIYDPIGAALSVLIGGVEVIAAIGDPNSLDKLVRKQDGESDLEFLTKIARENGWEMLIDHEGPLSGYQLRFMSPFDHLASDVTLKYGRSLIDFTPRVTTVGQIASVSGKIWWPLLKTEFTITVSWDWDRQSLDISIVPGMGMPAALSQSPENLQNAVNNAETDEDRIAAKKNLHRAEKSMEKANGANFSFLNEPLELSSAPRKILAELLPRLNSRLTGSGTTIGNPRIRPGSVLRLEGLGEQFGGHYRVTSSNHTFDSGGYRTSFEVRKEVWFGSIPLPEQGAVPIRVHGQKIPLGT